ncbi:tetratricopeptide repeat protein [Deinococcus ficus]|uniref:tetratricopeptide repeat protein n=1 Tax=Deinococcus ficus TaxID=317577 RepID=UPI000A06AC80|nr:tetratricopeptide repeat protein [Deinococcus ficus]
MTSMARNILMVGALLGSAALAGTPEGVRFYDAKNYAAALTELQPAAQRGDAQAMLYLAWMFLDGLGVPKDAPRAFQWALKSAEAGNARAMNQVGRQYALGQGVEADPVKAYSYFRQGAEAGEMRAMHNLANGYANGAGGLPVDLTLAFTWYKRAADLGLALSHGPVSDAYRQGRGVEKNERLALTYLERGVAAGDGYSLWRMGTVVQAGALGLAQDKPRAVSLFTQAANAGYAEGLTTLGDIAAADGQADKALEYYRQGAAAGNMQAMYRLGQAYDNASFGLTRDAVQAFDWYRTAADAGHAAAMTSTGYRYERGLGTKADPARALEYYRKGAAAGSDVAMYNLGVSYASGNLGLVKDDAQAFGWFLKAAEAGHAGAMGRLGYAYDTGTGTPQDSVRALASYRQAAAKGDALAMYNLGTVLENGRLGQPKDLVAAFGWYASAADAGNVYAMRALAVSYSRGTGALGTKDPVQAFGWYRKAADAGDLGATLTTGYLLLKGRGVTKDAAMAENYFRDVIRLASNQAERDAPAQLVSAMTRETQFNRRIDPLIAQLSAANKKINDNINLGNSSRDARYYTAARATADEAVQAIQDVIGEAQAVLSVYDALSRTLGIPTATAEYATDLRDTMTELNRKLEQFRKTSEDLRRAG